MYTPTYIQIVCNFICLPETLEFGSDTLYQYATGSVCQSLTAQPMKAIQHIALTNLNSVKKLHRIKNDWYANFSQWTNLKLILSYSTYQLAVHNIIFGWCHKHTPLHQTNKAPECINLILNHCQNSC